MDKIAVSGVMSTAIWIGSGALVLLVGTTVWGFARIVEYSRRIAMGFDHIERQLGLINDSIDELRRTIQSRNV